MTEKSSTVTCHTRELLSLGLDSEDDGRGTPFLWCLTTHGGSDRRAYRSADEVRSALESLASRFDVEVWTTNLLYELVNLYWPELDRVYPTFNRAGRVVAARLLGTKLLFRDTVAFLPASVRELGKLVGLPKLDFDFKKPPPRDSPEWERYCHRDALISVRAGEMIREGFVSIGVERLGHTAAGTSYKAFASRCHYPREHDDWCKGAYHGGRVETFRVGFVNGPVFRWDVRSMYPSAMLGKFPMPGSATPGWREGEHAWVKARVFVPKHLDPAPLPVKRFGRLIFPVGTFDGEWCGEELELAMTLGVRVFKVHEARTWRASCRPFETWIRTLWQLRQRGGALKLGAKIAANSLYGKFGQGKSRIVIRSGSALPYRWGSKYTFGTVDAEGYPECTRYAWAALITARARMRLDALLRACDGGAIYCDTDSVFSTRDALTQFEGENLGQLERLATCDAVEILAPKVYRMRFGGEWDYRTKGFSLALADDAINEAESLFSKGVFKAKMPLGFRQALRLDKRPHVWDYQTKTLTRGAGGRRILAGGKTEARELNE